uniref:Endonuclease V n=1 Tax=Arcella intermedia TaxID=1963864 RepID=A0A6B2LFK4_9EUKA
MDDGSLKYVAGVDISFVKGNEVDACACLIILTWPELKVVHSSFEMVQLTLPYIPGFLAFREVNFLVKLLDKLKAEKPEIYPQLVFVDGNGYLHPRGFGLACHLGVLTGLPCIGVGKTLMYVDGLEIKGVKQKFKKECLKPGDYSLLVGESSQVWGASLKSTTDCTNPIFVSIGHKVDLDFALKVTKLCCLYRIPEPIRQADLQSRDYLRINYKPKT